MDVKQENPLREEISHLGDMLGDTIREIAGEESLRIVEELRRLTWETSPVRDWQIASCTG